MPMCQSSVADGPVLVTDSCVDPALQEPYTDQDEQRSLRDPATTARVKFRYIHGGFTGTKAKFSFYFPTRARYRGLFFEPTYPTLGEEQAEKNPASLGGGRGAIAFAISNGAYLVSTNNAGGVQVAGAIGGYRVNAAAAKYSREVAKRVYGGSERPRGYLYGASGGAYQTVSAMESTTGVWDGAVPMVFGVPNAIPNFMTVQVLGLRVLRDKFPEIVDAMEPGGSGDPYGGLDAEQQKALRAITRLGFPLRGWWQYATLSGGAFAATAGGVRAFDGSYVDDFWTKPDYEGSDPSVRPARIQQDATVDRVVGSPPEGLALSPTPPAGDLVNADLVITSGAAQGKTLTIARINGNTVGLPTDVDPAVTSAIKAGDHVRLDNSWLVALEYYQRHQVPGPDQYAWNQFRGPDGAPIYPQRPTLVGPTFTRIAGGSVPNGHFHGKMIMLGSLMDVQAFLWSEDWYRKQAEAALGAQLDDNYRLWFMDNADHDPLGPAVTDAKAAANHIVSYEGELEQALLDLDAWVADGTAPPPSTSYEVDADTQVHVPASATERKGIQPVVTLSVTKIGRKRAAADERAEVGARQPVTFSATAEVPPGTGKIVRAEWDFEGDGKFPVRSRIRRVGETVRLNATHTFSNPGTYFAAVRVTSQRDGDRTARYGLVQNLGRIRVVVE